MKYSKDGLVCFDPSNHTYKKGDQYLQGVTGYIDKFKTPFDSDLIATRYAAKHGLNKDQVLSEWASEGERSRVHGTAVHKIIEGYILTGEIVLSGVSEKELVAKKFIEDYFLTGRLTPVESEMVVYNDILASQIDCIAKNEKDKYFILDWKTNKKISDIGYGKFMAHPYNRYPDCSFYHYSLQLSIYKKLCKEYPIEEAFIVHFKDSKAEILSIEQIELTL